MTQMPIAASVYLGLIVAASPWIWFVKKERNFVFVLILVTIFIGAGTSTIHQSDARQVINKALIIHQKHVQTLSIMKDVSMTNKGKYRYHIKNIIINSITDEQSPELGGFLYSESKLTVLPGDTIIAKGLWRVFDDQRNPGQFDLRKYYSRLGIHGMFFPDPDSPVTIIGSSSLTFDRVIFVLREGIRNRLNWYLDPKEAGLLTALTLGDKSGIDPDMKTNFQDSGIVHVLAVSGLHVGYILLILSVMVALFRIPWGWDRIVIIAGLFLFSAMTGFSASVSRASLMAGLYVLAPVVNRKANPWNILSAASLIILVLDPGQLFQTGFALSFAAVASILYFYQEIDKWLPERMRVNSIRSTPIRYTWALFLVSLSAQIGTVPITIMLFHRLPIIALAANVVIVPLIGIILALGIVLLTLSGIPLLAGIYANIIWLCITVVKTLAGWFAGLPFATIQVNQFSTIQIALYIVSLGMVVMYFNRQARRMLILGFVLVNILIWAWAGQSRDLNVLYLDVGQGDAAIVRFPGDKTMVVDAGSRFRERDDGKSIVIPGLQRLGVDHVDWLVLSHPHNDHIGGALSLLQTFRVDTVWLPDTDYNSWTYQRILDVVDEDGISIVHPVGGTARRLTPESIAQFFWPDTALTQEGNVNNLSIVFRIQFGANSFLFPGDLEWNAETELIGYGNQLHSNVLKSGHHGSGTSSSPAFLDQVTADLAVISVGENNKYKHPSKTVLNRYRDNGMTVYRTDQNEAVWLRSDGKKIKMVKWK